jgi:hypothetical protein
VDSATHEGDDVQGIPNATIADVTAIEIHKAMRYFRSPVEDNTFSPLCFASVSFEFSVCGSSLDWAFLRELGHQGPSSIIRNIRKAINPPLVFQLSGVL